jgi:pyrroline-5-carboxylate reductase
VSNRPGSAFESGGLLIVGAGVMGSALCEAVLAQGLATPEKITVAAPSPERREGLRARLGVRTVAQAAEGLPGALMVILAVKPQVFPQVAAELQGRIPESAVVLSIMAGLPIQRIADDLAHPAVVRSMPNAAARVLQSATIWCAAPAVTSDQRHLAQAVLEAIGEAIEVSDERFLDMATAVSGSGPAFLCLAAEAMIEGAVAVGFTRPMAQRLVYQTLTGTAALLAQPGAHPALVRESVTSPGGTTAAGLQALEQRAVRAAFVEAIRAALARAQELGSSR